MPPTLVEYGMRVTVPATLEAVEGVFAEFRRRVEGVAGRADRFAAELLLREAVVNAMIAADTVTGIKGHTVIALPHDRLRELLKKHNRLGQ